MGYACSMAKRTPKKKQPDHHQLARKVSDTIAPDAEQVQSEKNPAAVALGRLGGLKGGKARAEKLSRKQRSQIAAKAAAARWAKNQRRTNGPKRTN
jgi:hypothetical protein